MTKALDLTRFAYEVAHQSSADLVGAVVVLASAAALIFAGQPVPMPL